MVSFFLFHIGAGRLYFNTHAFEVSDVWLRNKSLRLTSYCENAPQNRIKVWMNRAADKYIRYFHWAFRSFHRFIHLCRDQTFLAVTLLHFSISSLVHFSKGVKRGGRVFKWSRVAVITRLSLSRCLSLSPLWPAVTFKSAFSYSSQSILSIEKAPAKPDLWTNKRCGERERWEANYLTTGEE